MSEQPAGAGGLTLGALQRQIHRMYGAKDEARGDAATFLWLTEEFGELATALRSGTRRGAGRWRWPTSWPGWPRWPTSGGSTSRRPSAEVRRSLPGLPGSPLRLRPGREAVMPTDLIPENDPTMTLATLPMRSDPRTRPVQGTVVPAGPRPARGPAGSRHDGDCLAGGTAAAAACRRGRSTSRSLRVGFVAGNQGNVFKLGTWTPVWVQLRAGPARFSGVMEVVVPDDDGTPTALRQVVDVAAGSSARSTTYIRPGTDHPELPRPVLEPGGSARWRRRRAPVKLDPMRPEETLLLVLGNPQGVELIPKLPGFKVDKDQTGAHEIIVAPSRHPAASVPGAGSATTRPSRSSSTPTTAS